MDISTVFFLVVTVVFGLLLLSTKNVTFIPLLALSVYLMLTPDVQRWVYWLFLLAVAISFLLLFLHKRKPAIVAGCVALAVALVAAFSPVASAATDKVEDARNDEIEVVTSDCPTAEMLADAHTILLKDLKALKSTDPGTDEYEEALEDYMHSSALHASVAHQWNTEKCVKERADAAAPPATTPPADDSSTSSSTPPTTADPGTTSPPSVETTVVTTTEEIDITYGLPVVTAVPGAPVDFGDQNASPVNTPAVLGPVPDWKSLLELGNQEPAYQACFTQRLGWTWPDVPERNVMAETLLAEGIEVSYGDTNVKVVSSLRFIQASMVDNLSDEEIFVGLEAAGVPDARAMVIIRFPGFVNTRSTHSGGCDAFVDKRPQVRVVLGSPVDYNDLTKGIDGTKGVVTGCGNPWTMLPPPTVEKPPADTPKGTPVPTTPTTVPPTTPTTVPPTVPPTVTTTTTVPPTTPTTVPPTVPCDGVKNTINAQGQCVPNTAAPLATLPPTTASTTTLPRAGPSTSVGDSGAGAPSTTAPAPLPSSTVAPPATMPATSSPPPSSTTIVGP